MGEWQDLKPDPSWDSDYAQIWCDNNRLNDLARDLRRTIKELKQQLQAEEGKVLVDREWLKGLPCPQRCVNEDGWRPEQCQFCDEREALLNTKESDDG